MSTVLDTGGHLLDLHEHLTDGLALSIQPGLLRQLPAVQQPMHLGCHLLRDHGFGVKCCVSGVAQSPLRLRVRDVGQRDRGHPFPPQRAHERDLRGI